jgi:hypothetical protein
MTIPAARSTLALLALAVLVAGCATTPPGTPRTFDCTGDCRVKVTVTCQFVMLCHASVDFDEVRARGQNVFWEIDDASNSNFVFDPDTGIEFKTAEGRQNFRCQRLANGRSFKCDNGNAPGKFEYGVKVIGVRRLDPWVVN